MSVGRHFLPILTSDAYGQSPEKDIKWTDPLVLLLTKDETVETIQKRNPDYSINDIVLEIYYFFEHYQPRAVSNVVDQRVLGQYERAVNTIEKRLKERYHVLQDRIRYHQDNKLYTAQHDPPAVHGIRRGVFDKRTPFFGAQTKSSRVSGSYDDSMPLTRSIHLNNYHPGIRHPAMVTRDQQRDPVAALYVKKTPDLLNRMSSRHQQLWK